MILSAAHKNGCGVKTAERAHLDGESSNRRLPRSRLSVQVRRAILRPMDSTKSPEREGRSLAEGMLLTTTLIWGGTFAATKVLLDSGMEPMGLLTWRFGIAALLFFLLFFNRLRKAFNVSTLKKGIVLGVLLYAGFGLQTVGLGFTSSSRSGFITALYVVITPLLQIFIGRSIPGKRVWLSVGLVTVGLWLLTSPAEGGMAGFNAGDLLTLGCAVSFAAYIIVLDRFGGKEDVIALTGFQLLVVAICCTLHNLLSEPWTSPSTSTDWSMILFLALLASVFTTWCQTNFQPRTTPGRAAIIYTMESVFAAIIGIALLGEHLGTSGFLGGGLIVGGLLVVEVSRD